MHAVEGTRTSRFGRANELRDLLRAAGLTGVREEEPAVSTEYAGLDELWATLELGIRPAGADFSLKAVARAKIGVVPV